LVDWDLQKSKPYVIVDPFDPAGLLYLSHHEYLVQQRTLGSMNAPFTVICRPGSKRPIPLNSPKKGGRWRKYHNGKYVFDLVPLAPERGQRPLPGPFSRGINLDEYLGFQELRSFMARNVVWSGDTVKVNERNLIGLIQVWGREILHYLDVKKIGAQADSIMPLAENLLHLLKHNGPDFLIKRLKILLFCLYSYLGGNPLKDTRPLGQAVRLSHGLPTCFGLPIRKSIRSGSLKRVRFLGSLLQMYKYIEGTHGKPDTGSIMASPFTGSTHDFDEFCSGIFLERLSVYLGRRPRFTYKSAAYLLISSAGANTAHAMSSIPLDAVAWAREPENLPLNWFRFHGDKKMATFMSTITQEALGIEFNSSAWLPYDGIAYPKDASNRLLFRRFLNSIFRPEYDHRIWPALESGLYNYVYEYLVERDNISDQTTFNLRRMLQDTISAEKIATWPDTELYYNLYMRQKLGEWPARVQTPSPMTGRLHPIDEAAGKVRVVAICDYFTQVALKPIHDFLFSILRTIPSDATFDQDGKLEEFSKRGYTDCYSYDLKSATDLIPRQLYSSIMRPMLGEESADLWLQMLSQRDFFVKPDAFGIPEPEDISDSKIRYTRGQPMGALSSWGALALLHHALVQFAAQNSGFVGWFDAYLVLGDDIIIADKSVAEAYLKVCEKYGITISIAKSLVSNKGLINFASQVVIAGQNISPLSLREELGSQTMSQRLEFAKRICRRWDGGDDKGVSTLRYILTHPQWQALQAELKGERQGKTLDLLRFYLLHPFKEGCNIGKIRDWLGFASRGLSELPPSKVQELEIQLRQNLYSDLVQRYDRMSTMALRLKAEAMEVSCSESRYRGTFRAAVWSYVGETVVRHVENNHLDPLGPFCGYLEWALWQPKSRQDPMIVPLEALPSLETLITWWLELAKIPSLTSIKHLVDDFPTNIFHIIKQVDPAKKIETTVTKSWFRKKVKFLPSWTKIKEAFRIPKLPVAKAVRRVLGAPLPIFTVINGKTPPSISRQLLLAKKFYLTDKIDTSASPCMADEKSQLLRAPVGEFLANRLRILTDFVNWSGRHR
jgi:hypothetical protein